MKKLVLFFAMLVCSLATWADNAVSATYSGKDLSVILTNDVNYVAFQMDITVPTGLTTNDEGLTVSPLRLKDDGSVTISGASYTTNFVLKTNLISSTSETNTYRVIGYNLGNHIIQGESGTEMFKVTFTGDDNISSASFDNILFVTEDKLEEIKLAAAEAIAGGKKGDVDDDGDWDLDDIYALIDIMAGINQDSEGHSYNLDNADVTGDGNKDIDDIYAIIEIMASL